MGGMPETSDAARGPSSGSAGGSPADRSGAEEFDAVVLGVGSGGEVVAGRLADAGWQVAAVEAGRVGGICPYVACVPSKAMLLAATRHRSRGGDHGGAWHAAVSARDEAAEHRDDRGAAGDLSERGVRVIRGRGEVTERDASGRGGVVTVRSDGDRRRLAWSRALVIGTGAAPLAPPVEGLDGVPTWLPEQALCDPGRPARLIVLGGGAVGCELAQVYSSFGTEVTLVETEPRPLASEADWVGERIARVLGECGVGVRTGVTAERAVPSGDGVRLYLSDGSVCEADRVLVATGRRPRSGGLGLGVLDIVIEDGDALTVDGRCRVRVGGAEPDDVFAVGDVTGVAPFTHTATYQGRIVAAHLMGAGRDADYSGLPRILYTHPAVYGVGLSAAAAEADGIATRTAGLDVEQTGRAFVEMQAGGLDGELGRVELVADARSGRLLGAAAVGPSADSWAGQLGLAVRAGVGLDVLADQVQGFPTWQEVLQPVAEELSAGG